MKKKISIIITLILITVNSSVVFADESQAKVDSVNRDTQVTPTMNFSKDIKTLSLSEAQKKMTTDSPSKTLIDMNKKETLNKGQGHLENVQSFNDLIKSGEGPSGTKAQREAERCIRDFANSQAQPNFDAEINKLTLDTTTKYFQLKQAEEMEVIASENYNLKKTLLANTQKKLEVGTVSKMDLLQAESALNTAKDELFEAQNKLKSAKMAFNIFMGNNIMQSVKVTDALTQVNLPSKTLETSIKEALVNRNEISAANFGVKYSKLSFEVFKDYPKNAANYLNTQWAVANAEKSLNDITLGVEMDVRNKYITIKQKNEAITTGKKNVANAKESVRLAQLQYDVGMSTLTAVNDAQIALNRAEVGLSQNLLDYNLAVEEYNLASGVGTTTAPIN